MFIEQKFFMPNDKEKPKTHGKTGKTMRILSLLEYGNPGMFPMYAVPSMM